MQHFKPDVMTEFFENTLIMMFFGDLIWLLPSSFVSIVDQYWSLLVTSLRNVFLACSFQIFQYDVRLIKMDPSSYKWSYGAPLKGLIHR